MHLVSFDFLGAVALLKLRKMPTIHWIYIASLTWPGCFFVVVENTKIKGKSNLAMPDYIQ